MINLGDITKISGYNAPIVDVVIGGSPCQDLSIAGKRAGLAGERSGLYMEQIRIIKEMREHDQSNGRAAEFIRPRYMVWENVPGAFSSNHGKDFAAVLEEAVRVIEPEAPNVPVPEKGWPTSGCLMGDGWSVSWRVLDAQFWGVSQRRRRIALVADFGGHTAPEILFVRESVSGDSETGREKGKGTAGDAENGVRATVDGVKCLTQWDCQSKRVFDPSGSMSTYQAMGDGGANNVAVCYSFDALASNSMKSANPHSGCREIEVSKTLDTTDPNPSKNQGGIAIVQPTLCMNDQGGSVMSVSEDMAGTLREHEHGHQPAICIQGNCIDRADTAGCNGKGWRDDDVSFTLNTIDRPAVYAMSSKQQTLTVTQDVSNTICANDYKEPQVAYAIENHPADSRVKISYNGVVQTLSSRMGTGGGNVPMVAYGIGNGQADGCATPAYEVAKTLDTMHDAQAVFCCAAVDCRDGTENPDINGTLQAKPNGGMSLNLQNVVREYSIVRRLTPLEYERLQGFPSEKKWDVSKMTKDEYIAWNLAEKNIIVDAEKGVVYGTRGPGGIPYKEPKQLKGSVVNGYNVVSLRNGATKLQCRVHRIVWISQNGIIPEGYCIDHINNDKQDNRISNLQIMTPSENSKKAKEDGLFAEGLDNKATKLDPDLHDELCYLYEFSDLTQRELAEIYGISKSRVNQIIKEVGWTDIGDWVDSNGKKRQTTDSARYKALGNSIALPPWKWVLKRLCAQYERDATMASLFDGIGGFPLIWEQLNGRGSCLWASEIDEFPIAVTRKRFREEQ